MACGNPSNMATPSAPLRASLLPPTHGIGFYVNQQAYVAIFDIVPGRGIGLYYPHMNRELEYAVQPGPRWVTNSVPYMNAAYRTPLLNPVHYLFLVASRESLSIDDYIGYDDYLRQKLGPAVFTGHAYTAMKALVQEVVPAQAAEDWATALYIVYGGDRQGRGARIYQLVYCQDGRMYWVDINRGLFICPPASDTTTIKNVLEEDGKKPLDKKTLDKRGILLLNPVNAAEASALLRRPVARIERVPMPPETRGYSQPTFSSDRGGRSSPTFGSTPPATTATSTVETPAQPPSNPRGRVTEDSKGGQAPQ